MTLHEWRTLTPDDYREMPWKNGLGVTTELAALATDTGFLWRISRAKIAVSGPFSSFPGYDRVIVHLGGGAVQLRHSDAEPLLLLPFRPHQFSGDDLTTATLDGPAADDFNLITQRAGCRGMLMFDELPMGTPHLLAAGQLTTHFVYVLNGSLQVATGDRTHTLSAEKLGSLFGPADSPLQLRATKPNTSYLLATLALGSQP